MRKVITRLLGSPWWSALLTCFVIAVMTRIMLRQKPGMGAMDLYALGIVCIPMLAAFVYQLVIRKRLRAFASLAILLLLVPMGGMMMLASVHLIHDAERPWEWYATEVDLPEGIGELTLHYQTWHAPDMIPVPGSERYYNVVFCPKNGHETAVDLDIIFGRPDFNLFLVTNGNRRVLDVDYSDGGPEPRHVYFDLTLGKQIDGFKGKSTRLGTMKQTGSGEGKDYEFVPYQKDKQ